MPLQRCTSDGTRGWRWGGHGACYIGPGARARALHQGQAAYAAGYREGKALRPTAARVRDVGYLAAWLRMLEVIQRPMRLRAETELRHQAAELEHAYNRSASPAEVGALLEEARPDWQRLVVRNARAAGDQAASFKLRFYHQTNAPKWLEAPERKDLRRPLLPDGLESDLPPGFPLDELLLTGAPAFYLPARRAAMLEILSQRGLDASVSIAETSKAWALGTIQAGVARGDSRLQIAADLRKGLEDLSVPRARTIARTETGIASSVASHEAFASLPEAPQLGRRWVTVMDGRERDWHAEADGQTAGMDEPFEVDGEEMLYPRDPSGSAENVINCRCDVITERSDATISRGLAERIRAHRAARG